MTAELKENILNYVYEENRLQTYKKWVFSDENPCNAAKLAEAGFIFVGNKHEPDSVKCFLCEKALDGWEAGDDPWSEHVKHSPKCTFAQLQSPEHSLTVNQFLQIKNEHITNMIKDIFESKKKEVQKKFDFLRNKMSRS